MSEKEKEEIEDIYSYLSDEQRQEIQKLEDELKKLKAENLANELKHKLQMKIREEKRRKKIEGKGLLQSYARVLKRFIDWWTMTDLSPEEKAEKKRRFEEATRKLFGSDFQMKDRENRFEEPRFYFDPLK